MNKAAIFGLLVWFSVSGCGNGLPWVGSGLLLESLLDPDEGAEDGEPGAEGLPGLACWDTNTDFGCQPAEDIDGDGDCTVLDCRGADSVVPGPPGITTVIVIHDPPVVDPPDDEPENDSPPPGHAYGHLTPPGNSRRPDGHRP